MKTGSDDCLFKPSLKMSGFNCKKPVELLVKITGVGAYCVESKNCHPGWAEPSDSVSILARRMSSALKHVPIVLLSVAVRLRS